MLFHALPKPAACDPFLLGMKAVEAAQTALCTHIKNGSLHGLNPVAQDKLQEIRYSRYVDFNDAVAEVYLNHLPTAQAIGERVKKQQRAHALVEAVYA